MKKRPTIALAMIVKNEAHHLPALFKSIEGCFDEVHITDTGSTDGTQAIVEAHGAKLHHFDWVDDFSEARNFSFDQVKTDFVMWMDGDDVLENREAFIRWRDDAMEYGDYWMAAYHYGLDASGKPNCTFVRERVFKTAKNFRWKYFVHEGVVPPANAGPIRPDYIGTWAIKHMRSMEDINADRSRNLKIFERHMKNLDARMKYYYGKELFENGSPMEAFRWLVDAIAEGSLENHDRILGIQYACMAAMQCNQYERAIQLAHQGLQLAPNRAEFHVMIGDSYVKLGRLADSIPAYGAAKNCINASPQGSSIAQPIFTNAECYSVMPRNQMAKVWATLGAFDKAKAEAEECQKLFNHPETQEILNQVTGAMKVISVSDEAKHCDDIVISCPPQAPYEWDAEIAKTKGMGGSETAAIEMAYWLKKISGRPVKVFNVRQEPKTVDGVEYLPVAKCNEYMSKNKPWAHIAWRHNFKVTSAPTFLWAHDLQTMGADVHQNYDRMFCLTPFHKRYAMAKQGVPEEKIWVTRNGLNISRWADGPDYRAKKNPNKIVFPSSPDRGLDRAMRVLDVVRETYPDIELHVFYGFENLRKYGLAAMADQLEAMIKERPWVKYHGFTQQNELVEHFKEAAIWLHPCDFIETSCISAMEILCSGAYPVTRRLGGLMDTLADAEKAGMATLLDHDCITESEYQAYIQATLKALSEKAWERVIVPAQSYSWEHVAAEWLRFLPEYIAQNHGPKSETLNGGLTHVSDVADRSGREACSPS